MLCPYPRLSPLPALPSNLTHADADVATTRRVLSQRRRRLLPTLLTPSSCSSLRTPTTPASTMRRPAQRSGARQRARWTSSLAVWALVAPSPARAVSSRRRTPTSRWVPAVNAHVDGMQRPWMVHHVGPPTQPLETPLASPLTFLHTSTPRMTLLLQGMAWHSRALADTDAPCCPPAAALASLYTAAGGGGAC